MIRCAQAPAQRACGMSLGLACSAEGAPSHASRPARRFCRRSARGVPGTANAAGSRGNPPAISISFQGAPKASHAPVPNFPQTRLFPVAQVTRDIIRTPRHTRAVTVRQASQAVGTSAAKARARAIDPVCATMHPLRQGCSRQIDKIRSRMPAPSGRCLKPPCRRHDRTPVRLQNGVDGRPAFACVRSSAPGASRRPREWPGPSRYVLQSQKAGVPGHATCPLPTGSTRQRSAMLPMDRPVAGASPQVRGEAAPHQGETCLALSEHDRAEANRLYILRDERKTGSP